MTRSANRLARLRRADALSREDVARRVGVEAATLAAWEDGAPIPAEHAAALARHFGVTVAWLTCDERLPTDVTRINRKRRFTPAREAKPRFARLRGAEGLTRARLAEIVGTSEEQVAAWEAGAELPDAEAQARLALRFGVSVDYLMGRERLDSDVVADGSDPA